MEKKSREGIGGSSLTTGGVIWDRYGESSGGGDRVGPGTVRGSGRGKDRTNARLNVVIGV
jgi:hypothetical protein